jgi:RNA polymerase sigma-70 factor (ECF subfamily)
MSRDLFWKLLEAEHPQTEAFCRKLTGNRDDGDDLYQDCVLHAWRKFANLRDHQAFRPWLYRIIVNMYKSRCRHLRLMRPAAETAGEMTEYSHDPSTDLHASLWLERAMTALSPEEKALISLFELEGWNVMELARMYGKPEGTIKSRLARARKKMRAELGRYVPIGEKMNLNVEAKYAMPRSEPSPE